MIVKQLHTKIKQGIAFFMALVLVILTPVTAKAVEQPTNAFYVNDFANVLPQDLAGHMVDALEIIEEETGAQAVFTTINYTGEKGIDAYAEEMYNQYQIGSKKGEGVLFLFVIKEDNYTLLPGTGFEDVITGDVARDIFDIIDPYFEDENYTDAVYNAFLETVSVLEKYYNFEIDLDTMALVGAAPTQGGNQANQQNQPAYKSQSVFSNIMTGIFIILAIIVIFSIFRGMIGIGGFRPYRRRPWWSPFRRRRYYGPRYPRYPRNNRSNQTGQTPVPPPKNTKTSSNNKGSGGSTRGGGFTRSSRSSTPNSRKTGSSWSSSAGSSSRGSSWGGSSSRRSGGSSSNRGGGGSSRGGGFSRK